MQTGATTVENYVFFSKKLKMELLSNSTIPLLAIYPKNPEILIGKNRCTPVFIAALFLIAKVWKQPKCPSVDECIEMLWYIHTMEFYMAIKTRNSYPLPQHGCTWRILCQAK